MIKGRLAANTSRPMARYMPTPDTMFHEPASYLPETTPVPRQANRRLSAMRQVMHPVTLSLRVKARSRRTVPAAAQGNVTDNDYVMLPVNVQARG